MKPLKQPRLELATFRTPLGWCAMLGQGDLLRGLTFGHRTVGGAMQWLGDIVEKIGDGGYVRSRWNKPLAKRIVESLDGRPDEFRDVNVDLSHLTTFMRRVVVVCRSLPWGETCSYAQLAAAAGSPKAARAVGQVMAGNRTPLVVPCHRVLASGGGLGGYSAPAGLRMKEYLLDMEADSLCV